MGENVSPGFQSKVKKAPDATIQPKIIPKICLYRLLWTADRMPR